MKIEVFADANSVAREAAAIIAAEARASVAAHGRFIAAFSGGHTPWLMLLALIQGAIVLMICSVAGFRIENFLLLPVALGFMSLIALFGNSIGTPIGSVLEDVQGFQLIMNFLVTPLFFFSNALFPVDGLPAPLKLLVHLNPLSYGIDGLRGALSHAFLFGQAIDFAILGGVTAILLGVGSYLFSRIQL